MRSLIEIRVLETRGSAPREAGTRMWVGATSASRDPVPLEAPATSENILRAIHALRH